METINVFSVVSGDYDGSSTHAVFSSREKAEAFASRLDGKAEDEPGGFVRVEEFALDHEPEVYNYIHVEMDKDGKVWHTRREILLYGMYTGAAMDISIFHDGNQVCLSNVVSTVDAAEAIRQTDRLRIRMLEGDVWPTDEEWADRNTHLDLVRELEILLEELIEEDSCTPQ